MKKVTTTAIILSLTITMMAQSSWPIFRGDQQLMGVSQERFETPPKLLWSMKPGGGILASPVVSNGIMIVGSEDGFVYAINEAGKRIWEFDTENAIEASALILDGVVFIGNLDGILYALDLKTGQKKWEYLTDNQIMGSPNYWLVNGKNRLVVGSYDYYLHCVDAETGDSLWRYESDNFINGAAGCSDGVGENRRSQAA